MRFLRRETPRAVVLAEDSPATRDTAGRVAIAGARARRRSTARRRIGMCAVVFVVAFAGLGARLTAVSFGAPDEVSRRWAVDARAFAGERPEILDRNGSLLAANLPMMALEVAGAEVWDAGEVARELAARIDDVDAGALEGKLRAGKYVEVAADVTPAQREEIFELGLPGVRFRARSARYFPQRSVGAHVVGHIRPAAGGAPEGVMGLEAHLENRLRGARAGEAGGAVIAALDVNVQQIVESELEAAVAAFKAKAGWAVVLDADTAEVVALSSFPDIDPNDPGAVEPDARRNRATYDTYELGSAFKAIAAATAIETGVADESTTYDARGVYRVADRPIRDYRAKNRVMTLSEVVQHSSNIGIAKAIADVGPKRQRAFIEALGLLDVLPIELPEVQAPRGPAKWGPVESATVAYGHGVSVTPLHLAAAFAAVLNGGVYRAPTFLKAVEPRAGVVIFSEETSAAMRRILRRVVTDGSAGAAEAAGYFPIGKTSTADKPSAGGYDRSRRLSSFIGAFPGHAPRYVVLVSLDEPKPVPGTHGFATAGWNAAPTFARIVTQIAPALNVMPAREGDALAAFLGVVPAARRAETALRPTGDAALSASAGG